MRYTLQSVIDVEGWHHHEEAVGVYRPDQSGDDEGVPRFVGLVGDGVGCVCEEKRDGDHVEVFECYGVVFFCFFFGFGQDVFVFEGDAIGDDGVGSGADAHVYYGGDFPEFEEDAHSLGEENHPA